MSLTDLFLRWSGYPFGRLPFILCLTGLLVRSVRRGRTCSGFTALRSSLSGGALLGCVVLEVVGMLGRGVAGLSKGVLSCTKPSSSPSIALGSKARLPRPPLALPIDLTPSLRVARLPALISNSNVVIRT